MNDDRDPRTRLLAETLQGDWADGPSAAMARRAAAHARRRRAMRRIAPVAAIAALLLAAILLRHSTPPPPPQITRSTPPRGYEIISDDELVRLLRDRPLLVLPEEHGAKKLVVLDR